MAPRQPPRNGTAARPRCWPRGLRGLRSRAAALSGGWQKPPRHCRGLGRCARSAAPRRTDQPPGSGRHRVAGESPRQFRIRHPGGQPRPLLFGKRGYRNGGVEPRLPGRPVPGARNYSAFLEKKSQYLEAQAKRQEALENRVRIELEWLRRGPRPALPRPRRASARRTRRSENWRRSGPEGASKPRISISRRRTAGPSGSFN